MAASGHADERDQQLIFLHPVGSNDQQKARRRTQLINSWECKQTTYQDQMISEYRNTGLIREEWKSGSYITEISLALSCSNRMIFHQIQIIPRGLLDPSSLSSVRFRMFWNSIHRGGTWKSYFFCTFPLFLSLYFFLLFFLYFFLVRRVLSTDGGHNGRQNKRNTAGEYPGPLIRPTRLPILHQTRHEEKEKAATGWDPLRGFKSLYHRTFISLARRKRVRKKKLKRRVLWLVSRPFQVACRQWPLVALQFRPVVLFHWNTPGFVGRKEGNYEPRWSAADPGRIVGRRKPLVCAFSA